MPPRVLPAPHGPIGLAGEPGLWGKSWEVSAPFGNLRYGGEKKGKNGRSGGAHLGVEKLRQSEEKG